MSLQKRVALITGSTSGIGLGIAKSLAKRGVNIVLNGFGNSNEIAKLNSSISKEFNVKVTFDGADLLKQSEIETMMGNIVKDHGSIDIVVNNAGIQHISPVETFPVDKWNAVIALNLSAVFHTTRLSIPKMRERGYGRIINIASVHGLIASVDKSAYVAAKHGVVGFTKATALELAKTNITCNAICPGWVLTPLVQKQIELRAEKLKISIEEAKISLLSEKQPSSEFVTVDQLGELTGFLCSEAASQVRGVAWAMDGGWTAQ